MGVGGDAIDAVSHQENMSMSSSNLGKCSIVSVPLPGRPRSWRMASMSVLIAWPLARLAVLDQWFLIPLH